MERNILSHTFLNDIKNILNEYLCGSATTMDYSLSSFQHFGHFLDFLDFLCTIALCLFKIFGFLEYATKR